MKKVSLYLSILVLVSTLPAKAQGPWSWPVNVGPPVNTAVADTQPFLSADGLSLYFLRFAGTNANAGLIMVSHRAKPDDPWSEPEPLPATVNVSGNTNATPFITSDGHWMYIGSNRSGTMGQNDLWRSYRNDVTKDSGPDGWQAAVNLGPGVNSTRQEQMGCAFTDEATGVTTFYFNSGRRLVGGIANDDIYQSIMQPDGTFGPVTPVTELNTDYVEQQPTCSRDGLEMYFTSNRPGGVLYPLDGHAGPAGQSSLDTWVSTRASTADSWGAPENLDFFNAALGGPPINSPYHDGRPSLSADGTTLVFFSPFRVGNVGPDCPDGPTCYFDVWMTTRPDTTAPNSPTPQVSPSPNSAGWNNADAVVSFTANGDPGHIATGVAECTSDVPVTQETAGTPVSGTCTDKAGNVSEPASVTIKLDKTVPSVEVTGVRDGASYLLGAAPSPSCSTTDAFSGVATVATLVVAGGTADGVGIFTATCSGASDVAGNIALPVTATYQVTYALTGFLPPLDAGGDFRLGSTVPVKWQLRDAAGNYISRLSSVQSLAIFYDRGCASASGTPTDLGSSGNTGLRYDAASNQFLFNLQTKGLSAGCYNLVLRLDDATVHSAQVNLR